MDLSAILLHFDDETAAAQRVAQAAELPARCVERHRFPDDELKLRLPVDAQGRLPEKIVLLRSLYQPNEKLVELLLAAQTARALGARRIVLVAPYLGYITMHCSPLRVRIAAFGASSSRTRTLARLWLRSGLP